MRALTPIRLTADWLGMDEQRLAAAPVWLVDAVAARLRDGGPESGLRGELAERLHESMARLRQLARTDQLTELANRRAVVERLSEEVARARRHDRQLAVYMLDVDGLKSVNDSLGHPAGDELLVEVGRRIEQTIRASDLVGRWGGDEFVVICPETDGAAASTLCEKLSSAISERPVELEGRVTPIGISVGFAVDSRSGTAESLLAAADAALYEAKLRRGRLVGRAHLSIG